MIHKLHESTVSRLIEQALFEDLGFGDVTTESVIPGETLATAHIVAHDDGVVSGLEVAGLVYRYIDMQITFSPLVNEGTVIKTGQTMVHIHGPLRGIIQGKQTALNFMMRMSGIATLTRQYVDKINDTKAKITGSRFTIPTLRMIDHMAVKAGEGIVRSFGVDEEIVVTKDHSDSSGGAKQALSKAFDYLKDKNANKPVSIEIHTFDELRDIFEYCSQLQRVVLVDFHPSVIPQAVESIASKTKIEARGGISLENVREVADAGVDYICIPDITHSPRALNFDLRISS